MTTKGTSAVQVLKDVYEHIRRILPKYNDQMQPAEKERFLADVCHEFNLLDALEVQVLYPALKPSMEDLIEQCSSENEHIKVLFAQMQRLMGNEEGFDSRLHELFGAIEEHLNQNEKLIFKRLGSSGLDLSKLANELLSKREQITTHTGGEKKRVF